MQPMRRETYAAKPLAGAVSEAKAAEGSVAIEPAKQPILNQAPTAAAGPQTRSLGLDEPTSFNHDMRNLSDSPGAKVAAGERCVEYVPLTLFVAPQSTGFEVTDAETTIPILFQSRTSADIFLRDSKRHDGACIASDTENDLKAGLDIFVIWRDKSVGDGHPVDTSPLTNPSLLSPNLRCTYPANLQFKAEGRTGPYYIVSGDNTHLASTDALLVLNSVGEAGRVFDTRAHMAADLCFLSSSDSVGSKPTHPVVAYFRY